jgi:hypothetical protein
MNSNEIKIQDLIDGNVLGLDNKIIRNMFEGPNINILKNVSEQLSKNNLESNFDVVFENSEKSGENKNVFIYKKNSINSIKDIPSLVSKNTAISIVCAAYFNEDNNRIVIASRLNTDLIKKSLPGFGGGPPTTEESTKDKDHIKWGYAKGLLKNNNYYKEYKLSDDELKLEFRNKMTEILKPSDLNWYQTKAQNSIVYREYIPDMQIVPDLNNIIIKFNVDFPIIFDKYNNILYYEKNIELFNIAPKKPYDIYKQKYKTQKGEEAEAKLAETPVKGAEPLAEPAGAAAAGAQEKPAEITSSNTSPETSSKEEEKDPNAPDKDQGGPEITSSNTSPETSSKEKQKDPNAPDKDKEGPADPNAPDKDKEEPADPNAPDEDKKGPADPNAPDENKGGPANPNAPDEDKEEPADPNAPDKDKGGPADPNAPDENKGGPAANKAPPATKTPPAAKITSLEDESGKGKGGEGKKRVVTQGSVSGGYKKKLKRKKLNTMSLNELKQLHRNNGIKMNGNKTVNALINNYIKNYK